MSLVCSRWRWDNHDLGHKAYESQNWIGNAENFVDKGEITNLHVNTSPAQAQCFYIERHEL